MTTGDPDPPPLVSVVIPARNAAATIDAQLATFAEQDYRGPIEVVVADNDSTDDTAERARAWVDRIPRLRVVDAGDRPGPAHARNVGIAAASSDLVLLCDADDVADRAWVRHLAAALGTADAVAGGTAGFRGDPPAEAAPPPPFGTAGFAFLPALSTSSAAIHRATWGAIDGFDETLRTGEDIDFAWRLQLEGFTLVQSPEAFVHYREPETARATLRTWYGYGLSQPALMKKFGPAGLPREPVTRVAAAWGRLVLHCYRLGGPAAARRTWCRDLGLRCGRVVATIRTRTLYL
ncbi:MAG: glycosyltransferase [Acidimicrobiia bacterium]|jgi:glycosyltransferase involved in cell wall biosynthesis